LYRPAIAWYSLHVVSAGWAGLADSMLVATVMTKSRPGKYVVWETSANMEKMEKNEKQQKQQQQQQRRKWRSEVYLTRTHTYIYL
jgi:hypothetical protein